MDKVIVVVGPTASGKTALAIEIAKKVNGEIVSCDSMQIYKYMDIGTAKPTADEQRQVKHHMIDFVDPMVNYSVADFTTQARACISDIIARGKVPVIAGGTGLYVDSIIENVIFPDIGEDPEYRQEMQTMAELCGNEALHNLLKEKDPQAADKIHPNNVRRVIRALEVCHLTGKSFTLVSADSVHEPVYETLIFGLDIDREILYDRVNRRVDIMLSNGLINEVRMLRDMGVKRESTAMQAIGYKEFMDYYNGFLTYEEAVEKIKMESRRYAKRQLTWFRRNSSINWIDPMIPENTKKIIDKCFTFLK